MKRKHDFVVEDERALVLPALAPFCRVAPQGVDRRRLAQNRLTAAPLDLLALLVRHLDDVTLQQLGLFLLDAYGVHTKKCFARYSALQCDALGVLSDELQRRPALHRTCVQARDTRILLANEPRNFPARIRPEQAAQHTERVVRGNRFVPLFVFLNCTLE